MHHKHNLNILFSNSIPADFWGGGEKWMLSAANGLKQRGHDIIIAARNNSLLLQRANQLGIKTISFNIHGEFCPLKIIKIANFLKKNKIDVVILNLIKDIRVVGFAARIAGVPLIVSRQGLQLFNDKLKYRLTLSLVNAIITNSQSLKDKYTKFHWMPSKKIKVIYNGLEIPDDVPGINLHKQFHLPPGAIIFGAAGRLTRQKGFDILIHAMKIVKERQLPVYVLIAGKGPLQKSLQNLINQNNISDRVKLIGFLNNPLPFLKSIWALILPSRREGMPNAVLEAMALHKPVIASNIEGINEVIEHKVNGFLFQKNDIQGLADAIHTLVTQPELAFNLGYRAHQLIQKKFSTEKMILSLEDFFYNKLNKLSEKSPFNQ
jgi:glycosyltransferase involved in cell wall biosynthesis